MSARRAGALALAALLASCATKPTEPQRFAVYFETGGATLTDEGRQVVAQAASAARAHPPSRITVEGHADGGTTNDAALADRRAIAVIGTLVGDGVAATAIEKIPGAPSEGASGVAAHQVIIRLMP